MNADDRVEGVQSPPGTPPQALAPGAEAVAEQAPAATESAGLPAIAEALQSAASAEVPQAQPPQQPEVPAEPRRLSRVVPAQIPLDRIDEDTTFQLRPLGEVSALATELARLGQLFPVDVRLMAPDRFQIVCGFRRVAALRFLKRDRVLARLHTELSDEDALLMALASAIHGAPVQGEHLEAWRTRLESEGRLSPIARDMLDKALGAEGALQSETVEEEVDADELAGQAAARLAEINQDLSLLADVFSSLEASRREELLTQLRYSSELVAWLESR